MNPPHGHLILSDVSIHARPNLDIVGVKFYSKLTFRDHVCGIVSLVFQGIGILRAAKCVFVHPSVLLCYYYAFILTIHQYYSPVRGSAVEHHLQLLKRQVYLLARWETCVINVMLLDFVCCTSYLELELLFVL